VTRLGVALLGAGLAGCGATATTTPVTVVSGTARSVPAGSLSVSLAGRPERSFIVAGGHWRVCDHGTVTNPSATVARDVRVVVTYLDHGLRVGGLGPQDAPGDGGALGDIPAGQSRPFTVCGLAGEEPDSDRVSAVVGA
jgi:hypothetical protein